MNSMVAIIKSVIGQVFAVSADGVKRQVFEGDRLVQGKQLLTGELGAVTLQTPDGQNIELGNNQQWPLPTGNAEQQDADTSRDDLLQAITAGIDLTESLPDTAAGPAETGGSGNGGGHSFVVLETTNQQVQLDTADTSTNPPSPALTREFAQERTETRLTPQQLDPVAPNASITANTASLQVDETAQVRFSFSEAIRGLSASAITVSGGTLSALTQVDATTWTATFTRGNSGAPNISLTAGSYTDQVGNPGLATSLAINGAPQASDASVSTDENSSLASQVPAANDPDSSIARYTLISGPSAGSLTFNPDGSYSFNPGSDFNDLAVGTTRQVSFSYNATDSSGAVSTPAIVTITVIGSNDAPLSTDLNLTTDEDVPVNGAISANDPDGDKLSYSLTGSPANGTVVLNPATGTFTYTPNAGYGGSDSFVVSVSDSNGGVATSTVTIGINSLNDDPVASDLNLTTAEDTAVNGAISATDPESDPLFYSVTGNPANGTVVLNPSTGTFVYTPNANYNGNDSFVVTISDGNGGTTTSNVAIIVTPENDAPVVGNQNLTTDENVAIPGSVGGSDPDGDSIRYSLLSAPDNGVLTLNIVNGNFTYTPNSGYVGSDSFTVALSDSEGGTTNSVINITVKDVNAAPVANDDIATVTEGNSVAIAVRGNDTDPENDSLSVSSITQGANGSVVIDAVTGNPIYTPNAGFLGNDSFTYTVQDPLGLTASATVNVLVKADAPSVLVQDLGSGPEDNDVTGNVLTNDTDTDDTLTVASFQVAGVGSFSAGQAALIAGVGSLVLNTNGSYTFDPVANWNGAVPQVTYTTNTGFSSTLDITVTPLNDAPVAVDDFYTINEDQVWSMPLPVQGLVTNDSDPDGDSLRVVTLENAVNGTLSVVSGNLVFTPNAEFSGTASFDYRVTDDKGGVDKGTVFINVVAVDDPTQAIDDVKTVAEGNNATGNVLANDVDPDTTPQVASFVFNGTTYAANDSVTLPGVGKFTLLANGDYTFEPIDNNFNGAVPTVTYTTDTGASADLNITLTPVNDAPVAVDDTFTIAMNTTLSLPIPLTILVANDTDVDNNTLRVTTVTSESNGTLQVISGNLVFTPTPGFIGVASFNYIVTDDKGGVDSGRVIVNVVAESNQAPETNALSVSGDEDTLMTINLAGSDSDGSVVGYVIKSLPANGLLYSNATITTVVAADDLVNGPVYFKPDANWNGTSQFNYAARDDKGLDDATPATVNINVNAVADAAVAGRSAGTLREMTLLNDDKNDYQDGSDGDDIGSTNAAQLLGSEASDIIFGSTGNDDLDGGIGNDTLLGGTGDDQLSGGKGADLFKWQAGDTGQDVILDFDHSAGDRIDLRDLLVNEQHGEITHYLRLDTTTSTLQISSTGQFASGGAADVTIKLEDGAGGNALPEFSGMSQSQIINSLIGGADPMLKVDQG